MEKLNQAIALAKAGDKAGARKLLRRFVAEYPQNEAGWGWLANCAENNTERRQALERVVEINPANEQARAVLEKMGATRPRPRPTPTRSIPARPRSSVKTEDKGKPRGCVRTTAIIILVIIILAFLGSLFDTDDSETGTKDKEPSSLEAWIACKDFVRRSLKAPSTAKFPTLDSSFVRKFENGNWRVSAWVDVQNSFGAMVRSSFVCILRYEGQEWHLKDIVIE